MKYSFHTSAVVLCIVLLAWSCDDSPAPAPSEQPKTPALVVQPDTVRSAPDSATVFTVTATDAPAQARYVWDFGDGTPALDAQGSTTAQHSFASQGNFTVTVTVYNGASQQPMASTTAHAHISTAYAATIPMLRLPTGLYIAVYETTQRQWKRVMGTSPALFPGDDLPIGTITWNDAVAFCNTLSELEGYTPCYSTSLGRVLCNFDANGYRLPTDEEWVYACRAGTEGTELYTGAIVHRICTPVDPAFDRAGWYCGNSGGAPHPVGQKEPNAFGLYDMHGNVWEMTWDWSDSTTKLTKRVKGGSWYNDAYMGDAAVWYDLPPDELFHIHGFRVVRNP